MGRGGKKKLSAINNYHAGRKERSLRLGCWKRGKKQNKLGPKKQGL